MRITPAKPADLERIAQADPLWSGVRPDMDGLWYVAREGRTRLGYIGLQRIPEGWYLQRYYVDPEWHSRGIGRALVRRGVREALRAARGDVLTYTMAANVVSANCLIACGFRLYDPAWAWVGRSGVLYWRLTARRASTRS